MKTLYHASREQQLADLVAMERLCSDTHGKLSKMLLEHYDCATIYSEKVISKLHKLLYTVHKTVLEMKPIRSSSRKSMMSDSLRISGIIDSETLKPMKTSDI